MKKFLTTILTILYFVSNTGATIHMHYCMGDMVEKNLNNSDKEQCVRCGMNKGEQEGKGCCKDEHKKIQIDQHQQVIDASVFALHFSSPAIIPNVYYDLPTIQITSITEGFPRSKAPPDITDVPIYKRNCVFRI